jgi:hypothetical protein
MAVALVLGAANCGGSMTPRPRVVVDSSFQAEDLAGIQRGLDAWEEAAPETIHFTRDTADHAAIIEMGRNVDANTVYIVRNEKSLDPDCPAHGVPTGDAANNTRERFSGGSVICVDATYVNAWRSHSTDVWKGIAIHEVGHSFYLEHDTSGEPSAMVNAFEHPAEVTCEDKRAFCRIWGCVPSC